MNANAAQITNIFRGFTKIIDVASL